MQRCVQGLRAALPLTRLCHVRPQRPAHSRASLVVVKASAEDVEDWQAAKMQQALTAAGGRRQVEVEKLCKQVGLPRQAVLQWLKAAPAPDRAQQSLQEARAAAVAAAEERQALLQASAQRAGGAGVDGLRRRQAGGSAQGGAGPKGSVPAWRSFPKKKKMGKQEEATLEMMYSRTQWPSDEAVAGLWDLHRLPRERVVEWFQQRRRQDQRRRGSGGSAPQSSPSSRPQQDGGDDSGSGKMDWDAEWAKE